MEKYKIQIKKSVEKDILSYEKSIRNRLLQTIHKLNKTPI